MRGTVDGVERRWMLYTVDDNADPVECGEYTRRCDAKRAAEVLVGQWWREKCEREALALGRLAELFGDERKAAAPVQYAFRAEGVEKVTAAFHALADSAKKAGESVRATAGIMSRFNPSPDTDIIVTVRDE